MASNILFLNNKTSKMVVNEVCVKRRLVCSWETPQIQQSPPVFSSVCKVKLEDGEEVEVEGYGRSKKEAEQCAAFKMIPRLLDSKELMQMTSAWKDIISEEKRVMETILKSEKGDSTDNEPISDTDDDEAVGEHIGMLTTLCSHCKLPLPVYKEEQVRCGLSKSLVFTITASVGNLSTQKGRKKQKQLAKRVAAFRVLRDLKDQGYETKGKKTKERAVEASGTSLVKTTEVSSSQEDPPQYSNIVVEDLGNDATDAGSSSSPAAGKRSKSPSRQLSQQPKEDEAPQMETGDLEVTTLKRKMLEEEEKLQDVFSSSSSLAKRKYELLNGEKLACFKQSANCLRFVKDYSHIFQHLPPNQLDEVLKPKEFEQMLQEHGGPLKLLEKSAVELSATLQFSKQCLPLQTSSENNLLILLVLKFENSKDFMVDFQNRHTFSGVGKSFQKAKEDAALNALKYLRQMMFTDEL